MKESRLSKRRGSRAGSRLICSLMPACSAPNRFCDRREEVSVARPLEKRWASASNGRPLCVPTCMQISGANNAAEAGERVESSAGFESEAPSHLDSQLAALMLRDVSFDNALQLCSVSAALRLICIVIYPNLRVEIIRISPNQRHSRTLANP